MRKIHTPKPDIYGLLLLDKPQGLTSNAALQRVKHLLKARKAGHTGSLDPIATGLLPLCFGEATKVSSFFLDADKRYWVRIELGVSTDTGDADGEVVARGTVPGNAVEVREALESFVGDILQVPPMYSAIKRNGQPLYKLARQGIEVEREPRPVTVFSLDVLRVEGARAEFELHCSHGFYVRSLAEDVGERLGCGAHVTALRRLTVGGLSVDDAWTIERIEAIDDLAGRRALLVPGDRGLGHVPSVSLSVDAAYYLCRGQPVRAPDAPRSGWVRLYSEGAGFLGFGTVLDDGRVAPKRLFHAHS